METKRSQTVMLRNNTTLTSKAIIHQHFGAQALYKVEEVHESADNGCPGLAISQKGPSLFRCTLQLPDLLFVSEACKKKKDAEQSAAKMALDKLGIHPSTNDPTTEEIWDQIVSRLAYMFSDDFLYSPHPLTGHLRAAFQRHADLCGSLPAFIIAVCDSKLCNLCKSINSRLESNPFLVIPYILRAATKLPNSLVTPKGEFSIQRQNKYPPLILESATQQSDCPANTWLKAIYIPSLLEQDIQPVTLNISSTGYYLDVIARELGLTDANNVLVSRTIGKASSETRLYFSAPESYEWDLSSDLLNVKDIQFEKPLNLRASYLCGQDVYGDAILASIGYTRRSTDLSLEDFSLRSYCRMFISKTPTGIYKLSRDVLLVPTLPSSFSTRINWRGSFPRDMLSAFCRQHRLSEPQFSTSSTSSKTSSLPPRSQKKLKITESAEEETIHVDGVGDGDGFGCEVKIYSKFQVLLIECSPKYRYKRQNDSIQNASLSVLSWIDAYFENPDMSLEKLKKLAEVSNIKFSSQDFLKEFASHQTLHSKHACIRVLNEPVSHNIGGPDSGIYASNGSLACIMYSACLVKGKDVKELVESSEDFEFEIGMEAVFPCLEAVVTQMAVGQSACFNVDLPAHDVILAAACDPVSIRSLLSSGTCSLEYAITLLSVTEPPEERMEQALFSPPLSKQRVEFAVKHIKECCATTLVDFGCGSGDLLNSLLDYPTSLEKIAGVDISTKALVRAAKMLNTKLNTKLETDVSSEGIKSLVLYDGSVTVFDNRLHGFDIGTCLEVIEHMEEDQACLFGDIVLSRFCPKILIVSTPNYEYNVILQKSNTNGQEEVDPEEKAHQPCKFRNHDHKFEWTRAQFNSWASELASRHNYSVGFSGVGGLSDTEPGFASQIAVFRRNFISEENKILKDENSEHCEVVWEWNNKGEMHTT
ncbi:hypothetical protein ACFE04_012330 [Oxalis oulophora]